MISDALAEALTAFIEDRPQVFTKDGIDYIGFKSVSQNALEMQDAGFMPREDFTISVLRIQPTFQSGSYVLPTVPESEEELTVDAVVYIISRVEASASS
jgi:hypothetical protein